MLYILEYNTFFFRYDEYFVWLFTNFHKNEFEIFRGTLWFGLGYRLSLVDNYCDPSSGFSLPHYTFMTVVYMVSNHHVYCQRRQADNNYSTLSKKTFSIISNDASWNNEAILVAYMGFISFKNRVSAIFMRILAQVHDFWSDFFPARFHASNVTPL